jgi:hypothetical protein
MARYAANLEEGSDTQAFARKEEYLALLQEQAAAMHELESLAGQQTSGSAGERLSSELSAVTQQIENLKRAKDELDARAGLESQQTGAEVQRMLTEAEARRTVLGSPQLRTLTGLYDARRIAGSRAQAEAGSYAVGQTEADKLVNQRTALEREMKGVWPRAGSLTPNEAVRAKELELALWKNQEAIQTRVVDLARQEKQIRLDANREFARALLLAGPGEQLQRLHVAQMMRRAGGVGPGEFMALSPEVRRILFEATGGEAGAMTRHERARLRGFGLSVEQEQAAFAGSQARSGELQKIIDKGTRAELGKLPPTTALPLVARAKEAADQLQGLAAAAANTTAMMKELGKQIGAIINSGRLPPATKQPSRMSSILSAGWSLGMSTLGLGPAL